MSLFAALQLSTRRTLLLAGGIVLAILGVTTWGFFGSGGRESTAIAAVSRLKLEDIPFDGRRAYAYLKELCAIGPRPSGSSGMEAQQKLLVEHFRKLGGHVELQRFRAKHPRNSSELPLANIIVHWDPEKTNRILLCAHYDTLPYPLRDPKNVRGRFIGANDNASGVAVLMELAHDMPALKSEYGIDFLLLDGEEFIFDDQRDPFFLGSRYFAEEYAKNPPPYHYRWGVLLDMVGSANLQLHQERNSLGWDDTQALVKEIWATAARLGVREFIPQPKHTVSDDHVMLHEVGHISCIDIIDFDYPPWHTQGDTPDHCSALSLAKVGWVLEEWLKTAK